MTEQNWALEAKRKAKEGEIPEGHGQIVREEPQTNVVAVKPPGSHVDEEGNDIAKFRQINQAENAPAAPDPGQPSQPVIPTHQIGAPPPQQGAQTPGGHGDPRLSPNSEPRSTVYRIQASTTSPAGAQAIDPQQGIQSVTQRSTPQGGVHRVGGQPVQPTQVGMAATVRAVRGDLSPAQAAQMLAQETQGIAPGTSQFQSRSAAIQPAAPGQPGQPGEPPPPDQPLPPGAKIVQENDLVTIAVADDETMRREMEAAGMQDRLPTQQTTIGRRVPAEQVAEAQPLDVTVILTSFLRHNMLARQIQALSVGTKRPANIGILVVGPGEHDANAMGDHPRNVYGLPITPWERFSVGLTVPTKYVCILDDDCLPGLGWLEACVDAMENGLEAVIACAGHRFAEDGAPDGYRGPIRHPSGAVIPSELDDPNLAVLVDAGDLGWFFKTKWLPSVAQLSPVGHPPYGWQIHATAAMQLEEGIPTVVLPYTDPGTWGATEPAMEDGLRENQGMPGLKKHVFDSYREEDWVLVGEMDQKAIAVPTVPPPGAEGQKPDLAPGTYWSPKLKRYVALEDPEWSGEHYELLTGEAWAGPPPEDPADPPQAPGGEPAPGASNAKADQNLRPNPTDAAVASSANMYGQGGPGGKGSLWVRNDELEIKEEEDGVVTLSPQLDTSGVALDPDGAVPRKKDAPGTLGRAPEGAASAAAPEPEPDPGPPPAAADTKPAVISLEAGEHEWCACGQSKKGPLCDKSCDGTPFTPVTFQLRKATPKVMLCQCKATQRAPYCDGRGHSKVALEQKEEAEADAKAEADAE